MRKPGCWMASVCLLFGPVQGAAKSGPGTPVPGTEALEAHLLEWPSFGPVFDDVVLAWCGAPGWETLDAQWSEHQSKDKRWALLRGLLAERQGMLDEAGVRYAEAGNGDWAHFQRGRLKAFLGEVEAGKRELRAAASQGTHAKVFELAAAALGEIAMLQKGTSEGEKVYGELWEKHPEVRMRLALLEPLLSIKAEKNAASAWLERLKPGTGNRKLAPAARAARAVLWLRGNYLLNGVWTLTPELIESFSSPGTEDLVLLLFHEIRLDSSPNMAALMRAGPQGAFGFFPEYSNAGDVVQKLILPAVERAAQAGRVSDSVLAYWLSSRAKKGVTDLCEGAKTAKDRLRQRPFLLATACRVIEGDSAGAAEAFLSREIFNGTNKPEWQVIRLWLRLRAGDKAEQLRDMAATLWQAAKVDARFPVYSDVLDGGSGPSGRRSFSTTLNVDAGTLEPSPDVIWNLRGSSFAERMAARFKIRLGQTLARSCGTYWPTFDYSSTDFRGSQDFAYVFQRLASGAGLRKAIWDSREKLGFDAASLNAANDRDVPLAEKIADTLITQNAKEAATTIKDLNGLDMVPTSLLMALLNSTRLSLPGLPREDPDGPILLKKLVDKVSAALLRQHPDWILDALTHGQPLEKVPQLTAALRDELMTVAASATNSGFRRPDTAEPPPSDEILQKIFPEFADPGKRAIAMLELRQRFGLNLTPHPLSGLLWKPSLERDKNCLRYAASRSRIVGPGANPNGGAPAFRTMPMMMPGPAGRLGPLGVVVSTEYGDAALRPVPERESELRGMAPRFPIVEDYLAIWDAMEHTQATVRGSDPRGTEAIEKALTAGLEKSKNARAGFTLAVARQLGGDQAKAKELAAAMKTIEGPLGRLADFIEHPPAPPEPGPEMIASFAKMEKQREEQAIDTAKAYLADPDAMAKLGPRIVGSGFREEGILTRIAMDPKSQAAVYEWLRREIKPEPKFAAHARLLYELARGLKRPEEEIHFAADLDLKLNADSPYPWLNRALAYAKEGNEKFALDLFLESVRRANFGNPPDYLSSFKYQEKTWVQRLAQAHRMADFAGVLTSGLEKTAPQQAGAIAAKFAVEIFQSPEMKPRPAALKRLLKIISDKQAQLLLFEFKGFREKVPTLEAEGQNELAVDLARGLLMSPLPEHFANKFWTDARNGRGSYPAGVRDANASWGSSEVSTPDGPIKKLLTKALEGEHAKFLQACDSVARENPKCDLVVSSAVVCRALTTRLSDEDLKLAAQLNDNGKFYVAWRLGKYAPPENLNLSSLAPLFEAGVQANLGKWHRTDGDGHYDYNGAMDDFNFALGVVPWLEKAGAAEALRRVLPALRERLPSADAGWMRTPIWEQVARLIILYGTQEDLDEIVNRWRSNSFARLEKFSKADETAELIAAQAATGLEGTGDRGVKFIELAADLWQKSCEQLGNKINPDPGATALVSEALLATGDEPRLAAFDKTLEKMIRFSQESGLKDVQRQFHLAMAMLADNDSQLPSIAARLQPSQDDKSPPEVHWEFSMPFGEETLAQDGMIAFRGFESKVRNPNAISKTSAAHLRRLAGRYDVEIYAGETPDSMQPVVRVPAAASEGTVETPKLPASGWLRAMVKSPRTGTISMGGSIPFSTRPVLLRTSPNPGGLAQAAANFPNWPAEWVAQFGHPITALATVATNTEYLLTLDPKSTAKLDEPDATAEVVLVALDAKKQPIGIWPAFGESSWSRRGRSNGAKTISWRFRPDQGSFVQGNLVPRNSRPEVEGATPEFMVFAVRNESASLLPLGEIRVFKTFERQTHAPPLPLLPMEPLATLGFAPKAWHLSDHFPRAAFVGDGQLAVFDTGLTPWKQLARMSSRNLTGNEWPLIFSNDLVQCVERSIPSKRKAGRRIIHLAADTAYDACERLELPFEFTHLEFSPFEDMAILMMGSGSTEPSRHLRVAWLDASGIKATLDLDRPRWPPYATTPQVFWWEKDGAMVLHEFDLLFKLKKKDGAFSLEKLSTGSPKLDDVPKGATPGGTMQPDRWTLKDRTLLLESDPRSGKIIRGFRLPVACEGPPMQSSDDSPLILKTSQHDLIQVKPGPTR